MPTLPASIRPYRSAAFVLVLVTAAVVLMIGAFEAMWSAARDTEREVTMSTLRGRSDAEKFRTALERALRDAPNAAQELAFRYEIFVGRIHDADAALRAYDDASDASAEARALLTAVAGFDRIMRDDALDHQAKAAAIAAPLDDAMRVYDRLESRILQLSSETHARNLRATENMFAVAAIGSGLAMIALAAIWRVTQRSATELAAEAEHRRRFLDHISHEFRTPLNAIHGFAELVLHGYATLSDDKKREYLQDISRSAIALDDMTCAAIELSRVEAGRIALRCEELSPRDVLEPLAEKLAAAAKAKNLRFRLDIADEERIQVDAVHLRRALKQLLENAVKFAPARSEILLRYQGGAFQIQDQGPGVSEDELDAVWRAYSRNSKTRTQGQGVGLGLPLARAVIEIHGGVARLRNTPGGGALAELILPRERRKPSPAAIAA